MIHEIHTVEQRDVDSWAAVCTCGKRFPAYSRHDAVTRQEQHAHEKNRPGCPTPAKKAYKSRWACERDLARRWRSDCSSLLVDLKAYQCACGRWHFTKSTPSGGGGDHRSSQ
jgi:hypothetical protein